MITRAQAEALLTLAESLEACERLNVELVVDNTDTLWVSCGEGSEEGHVVPDFSGIQVRLALLGMLHGRTGEFHFRANDESNTDLVTALKRLEEAERRCEEVNKASKWTPTIPARDELVDDPAYGVIPLNLQKNLRGE